jgi:GTP-binding protein EngB required for normal cell division
MDLKAYEDSKFALAQLVRGASEGLHQRDATDGERIRELFARLAEDRFNVVVVGHFNRGKTSLMNALLGTDRLPTGILPLTSVITTVSYGSQEAVSIRYRQGGLPSAIAFDALPEYLTQNGNPGNVRNVKTADVQLPVELLRRGFYLVDTPGLGSAIRENTWTTEEYLTEADAFFLVTAYDAPLSSDEVVVLNEALAGRQHVFVIVNKHDIVAPDERASTMAFVRDQLAALGDVSRVTFHTVSAKLALDARRSSDGSLFVQSGIPELELQLTQFLLEKKASEFLLRTSTRLSNLLRPLQDDPSAAAILARITAFQSAIRPDAIASGGSAEDYPSLPVRSEPFPVYACDVCDAVADAVLAHLRQYQYDLSTDEETQMSHAQRGGFCPFHAWQYATLASPQGIAKAYPELLNRVAAAMRLECDGLVRQGMNDAAVPARCPTCAVASRAERTALRETVQRLDKNGSADARDGRLCLPHLRPILARLGPSEAATVLLRAEATLLERLAEDLQRYALKHDALRRALTTEEERRATDNALLVLSGKRSVCGPAGRSDYL